MNKQLTRIRDGRMFLGVAGGVANYLNIDPVFVRLAFVLLGFAKGIGLLIYLVLALVMREENVPAKVEPFSEEEIKIHA